MTYVLELLKSLNSVAVCHVQCTSRLTGCKRPWWSNRIVYKQVWESIKTVWQVIQTVWFDWGYRLTQIQSKRIAHMCYQKQSELICVRLNIFNNWLYGIPLFKYTFVITATITILPLFNSSPLGLLSSWLLHWYWSLDFEICSIFIYIWNKCPPQNWNIGGIAKNIFRHGLLPHTLLQVYATAIQRHLKLDLETVIISLILYVGLYYWSGNRDETWRFRNCFQLLLRLSEASENEHILTDSLL